MARDILVRDVPAHLQAWISDEAHQRRMSQREFVVTVLDRARSGDGRHPLFERVAQPPRTDPEALPFTFVDLFAGIGGLRLALEAVGGRSRFSCEWDTYCQKTYRSWFGETPAGDIRKVDIATIPEHDVLAAGFPCQPFSIAGVSKKQSLGRAHGFKDVTQGTLFFHLANIIELRRPRVLLLENVKNLQSHDRGQTWQVILSTLENLGYRVFAKVIDAAGWVPQHRERVFIVGFDLKIFGRNPPFDFPTPPSRPPARFREILESKPDLKYTLSDQLWKYLQDYAKKHQELGNGFGFGLVDLDGRSRTLSARYYKDGSEILIPQKGRNPRRLMPREAARLMGFPESLDIVVSDTQAYRQFGNAVVPPVAEAVSRQIVKVMTWHLRKPSGGCLISRNGHAASTVTAR